MNTSNKSTPPAAGEAAHIAQIQSAMALQRGFYTAEINAGRDLYKNNARAEARSHEAERFALRACNSYAALVAIEQAAREYLRVHDSKGGEDYDGSLAALRTALNSAKGVQS